MIFEHRVTIEASKSQIWDLLSDFPRAAKLMPDVSDVKQQEDGSYGGTMRIRIGPIGLNLAGTIDVQQDDDIGLWNMKASAQDRRVGGGLQATIRVELVESSPAASELSVTADVQLLGRLGQLGQPLIKRKANSTIQEFAENLKAAVSSESA